MSSKFHTQFSLKFRDTDPAGIMYFANIFSLAHDAFEEFIVASGFTWKEWFEPNKDFAVPIRHAECDYTKPLKGGQVYDVYVSVIAFGSTSFTVRYEFMQGQALHATVKTVHSMLDFNKFTKVPIPENYKSRLERFYVG